MLALLKNILQPRYIRPHRIIELPRFSTAANVENKSSDIAVNISTLPDEAKLQTELEKDKLYSRLEIEIKGADPAVLKSYAWFATTTAQHLEIEIGKCWAVKRPHHDRLTLLKSVHIFKKHRVQYEIRSYFRYMNFMKLTGSTLDTFLEYIERNLPEGVALKVTKTEIQEIPEHLSQPPTSPTA